MKTKTPKPQKIAFRVNVEIPAGNSPHLTTDERAAVIHGEMVRRLKQTGLDPTAPKVTVSRCR